MTKVDLIKLDTRGSECNFGGIAAWGVLDDYTAQWAYTVFDIADMHRDRGRIFLLQAYLISVSQDSAWRKKESWLW